MRKTESLVILLLLILIPAFGMSVEGTELENPFPSGENLALFSFEDGEGVPDMSDWQINLVSTRTGGPVYAWFGHTSLEIIPPYGTPLFYDYGYFTFSEGFYMNFALGRLYYNMYGSYADMRIDAFRREDRTVWRTPLPLTDGEKYGIVEFLRYNEKPENDTYLYHYYNDNCATRVRDIIDAATGGEFGEWARSVDTGHTLRSLSSMYLDKSPLVSFAVNYLQGPLVDRPVTLWEAMFLPEVLQWAVEEHFGVESEMVNESSSLRDHRTMPLSAACLVIGLSWSVLTVAAKKLGRKGLHRFLEIVSGFIWIVLGVLSSVLLFMQVFTNHDVTYFNENLLYISPLVFIMGFEALRGKNTKKRCWIALLHLGACLAVSIVKLAAPSLFWQANAPVFLMMIPLYLSEIIRNRPQEETAD